MEAAGTCDIFNRSVKLYNLRYTGFVGDRDTTTYKKVCEQMPYGDKRVEKMECVGHVQKRVGTRLGKLKQTTKAGDVADDKGLGGKGRLTDKETDQMQTYFGNAIRANPKDIVGMRKAVGAVYFHKKSSDEDPVHNFCDVSWCLFLKAKQEGKPYTHSSNSYLPSAVMDLVKPVWKD